MLGWMLRIPLGYWFFCVLEGRPFWPDPFLTMEVLYQLSYVGTARMVPLWLSRLLAACCRAARRLRTCAGPC